MVEKHVFLGRNNSFPHIFNTFKCLWGPKDDPALKKYHSKSTSLENSITKMYIVFFATYRWASFCGVAKFLVY